MNKENQKPDFKLLADGIVLAEERDQKLSEMDNQIQALTRLCERLEKNIEKYSLIEQNINNGVLRIHSSVVEMGHIRDNIRQLIDAKINTTLNLKLNDVDGTLTRFERNINRCVKEGADECRGVVDDVAYSLKSLLIGKTNDMEPIFISAKTKHWIICSSVLLFLSLCGVIALLISFR